MINSTSYGVHNTGQLSATNTVSLKTIYNNVINTRGSRLLFAALLLLLCSASNKSFGFGTPYYYPTSATAGAGGTYCIGTTATGISGTIFTASGTAVGAVSSTATWAWYYNTTGATGTLAGATLAFTGSTYTAGPASVTANLPAASISTAVGGIYYYFLYVSYSGGTAPAGTVYSNLSTVIIGAGAITGPSSTCVGSSTALSDLVPSGTWSSSNPGVASITAGGGVVTGITQGTATITYTGSSGCITTRVQTVNDLAAAISGTPQACPGTTTSLSDASTGGTWTSGTPGTATITPVGLVTGVATGTTIITYDNGCGTPANLVVTVYPFPGAIIGPNNVCADSATIVMSDDSTGGIWTSSTPPVAIATTTSTTTGLIMGLTGGTTLISYTRLGCTVSTQITVTSLPAAIAGSLKQCTGSSITLSDSLAGGIWTSFTVPVASVGSSSGIVTGADAGTTTITYTTSCGFVTAVDTTVGIPDSILGNDNVCVGANTVFADVVLGGVWTSSDTTHAKVLTGSGIISGISAGTATITYTVPPGCFITRRVTVNPLPGAIMGTRTLCPGTTVTLSDALAGGTWSSLRSFVASAAPTTGVITGVTADTATIIYTSNKGCTAHAVVTVNPAPLPITGGITTCGLSTDTVYDATPGGVWSNSPTTIATVGAATGIVTTISGGTTVITYTLLSTTGCFATKVLTVKPSPVPVVTYNNSTITFYTDNYYTSYQWYDSLEGAIPGAISFQTAALYNGNYWVVVTDSNGCVGASLPVHFGINNVGVKAINNDNVRIYPNPTSSVLNIESLVRVRAVITGIDGKTEMEQADAKQMNIGGLANGMYFISLYNDNGERLMVQKLIKQ